MTSKSTNQPTVQIARNLNINNELCPTSTPITETTAKLEVSPESLREEPSGTFFGLVQNHAMMLGSSDSKGAVGKVSDALNPNFLILTTSGGIRDANGNAVALGAHTGHWELNDLAMVVAKRLKEQGALPFALHASDLCDGRIQGTTGMMCSLASRWTLYNMFLMQIEGIPQRKGIIGIGTCDKGFPAITMALARAADRYKEMPLIAIPGGVTLPVKDGWDAGKVQAVPALFSAGKLTLKEAQEVGCRACGSPGGGCQFLGTAATAQVVGEALGLTVSHAALAPSGSGVWRAMAEDSATAIYGMYQNKISGRAILTDKSVKNSIVVHAAFGGSTNLLLHIPAYARLAGLACPTRSDFDNASKSVPRLVDCLPNGDHPTIRVYLAGGVPEVMLHLRDLGLLELDCMTVHGVELGFVLEEWEKSERRLKFKDHLFTQDGVSPDDVIMSPKIARERGMSGTVVFPEGNIAPLGSVVKATAIDSSLLDSKGVYKKVGKARTFLSEQTAIKAFKSNQIHPDEVVIVMCRGPIGAGMPETYEITSTIKHVPQYKNVPLLTDARFSGVSTGPCVGHISPEALSPNSPLGKVRDGDTIEMIIDTVALEGSINVVGENGNYVSKEFGDKLLNHRVSREDLAPDPDMLDEVYAWAVDQDKAGGIWRGAIPDYRKR